eukprot:26821_1
MMGPDPTVFCRLNCLTSRNSRKRLQVNCNSFLQKTFFLDIDSVVFEPQLRFLGSNVVEDWTDLPVDFFITTPESANEYLNAPHYDTHTFANPRPPSRARRLQQVVSNTPKVQLKTNAVVANERGVFLVLFDELQRVLNKIAPHDPHYLPSLNPYLALSDAEYQHQTEFKEFPPDKSGRTSLPTVYFDADPLLCPFYPPRRVPRPLAPIVPVHHRPPVVSLKAALPKRGYCEICQNHYDEGLGQHKTSMKHIKTVEQLDFTELDSLFGIINERFRRRQLQNGASSSAVSSSPVYDSDDGSWSRSEYSDEERTENDGKDVVGTTSGEAEESYESDDENCAIDSKKFDHPNGSAKFRFQDGLFKSPATENRQKSFKHITLCSTPLAIPRARPLLHEPVRSTVKAGSGGAHAACARQMKVQVLDRPSRNQMNIPVKMQISSAKKVAVLGPEAISSSGSPTGQVSRRSCRVANPLASKTPVASPLTNKTPVANPLTDKEHVASPFTTIASPLGSPVASSLTVSSLTTSSLVAKLPAASPLTNKAPAASPLGSPAASSLTASSLAASPIVPYRSNFSRVKPKSRHKFMRALQPRNVNSVQRHVLSPKLSKFCFKIPESSKENKAKQFAHISAKPMKQQHVGASRKLFRAHSRISTKQSLTPDTHSISKPAVLTRSRSMAKLGGTRAKLNRGGKVTNSRLPKPAPLRVLMISRSNSTAGLQCKSQRARIQMKKSSNSKCSLSDKSTSSKSKRQAAMPPPSRTPKRLRHSVH